MPDGKPGDHPFTGIVHLGIDVYSARRGFEYFDGPIDFVMAE